MIVLSNVKKIGWFFHDPFSTKIALMCNFSTEHYHLQVQANPILQKKPMLFLASMWETGLTHDIFFEFSLGPFEVVEAEGGRLVKEADFEAEIFFLLKQII